MTTSGAEPAPGAPEAPAAPADLPPPPPADLPPPRPAARWAVRIVKILGVLLVVLVLAFVVFYFWASGGDSDDRPVAPGMVLDNAAGAPPPDAPATLAVVTFNIGYGRGPAGDESGPWTEAHVRHHLDAIARQIGDSGADIAFLQEVDLGAARTHDIDEGRYLLERLGWRHGSCVVTWERNYVPFPYWPPSRHYGRMKSGQCVLSRFAVRSSTRHRLPQPEDSPFWRNAFYFHRAVDHVQLEIGKDLYDLFHVHLEAFSVQNRMEQALLLVELVQREAKTGQVILAGDFNTLPAGATQKNGFIDETQADFTADTTHDIVLRGLPALSEALPDVSVFTFPAEAPTRRLDYLWFGAGLALESARVLAPPPGPWSDHLPLFARLRLH